MTAWLALADLDWVGVRSQRHRLRVVRSTPRAEFRTLGLPP